MSRNNLYSEAYGELLQKIDVFIRKYYLNQLIRGLIYSGGGILVFFLFSPI